jgi:hypothetical protein
MLHRDSQVSVGGIVIYRETFATDYNSSDFFNVSHVETPSTPADFTLEFLYTNTTIMLRVI